MLARLITAVIQGMVYQPAEIMLFMDTECIISTVDSDNRLLGVWMVNRADEWVGHMSSWRTKGIKVPEIHHWPGTLNPADLGTRGAAVQKQICAGSEWQTGPAVLAYPRETWPATREFRRQLPKEELLVKVHGSQVLVCNVLAADIPGEGYSYEELKDCCDYIRTRRRVEHAMAYSNNLKKVERILARIMTAGRAASEDVRKEPSVVSIREARLAMEVVSAVELIPLVRKQLTTLVPELSKGRWVTRGRLRKNIKPILGTKELVILMPKQRLAVLIMIDAHNKCHERGAGTLAKSRSRAWIVRGRKLAAKVASSCVYCRKRDAELLKQRMGQLPIERAAIYSSPFAGVCLDLMGPVLVKGVVNARAQKKVWPVLFVCQATGALHICLMHDYGTQAFLLQYRSFVAIRGKPSKVTSDRGSQLTSKGNSVISPKEHPDGWDWDSVAEQTAQEETRGEFVPAGCQYRNGLAENRVKIVKRTLAHVFAKTMENKLLMYAELLVLLQEVANLVNDRPVSLRDLTEEEIVPLTVNQLLIGRNSDQPAQYDDSGELNVNRLKTYSSDLLRAWWKEWRTQGLPRLLPFHGKAEAMVGRNLVPGDVCQLLYKTKVSSYYRLCVVKEVKPSEDGVVRTVVVGLRNRRSKDSKAGHSEPVKLEVGVQRLCLILPREDQTKVEVGLTDKVMQD